MTFYVLCFHLSHSPIFTNFHVGNYNSHLDPSAYVSKLKAILNYYENCKNRERLVYFINIVSNE